MPDTHAIAVLVSLWPTLWFGNLMYPYGWNSQRRPAFKRCLSRISSRKHFIFGTQSHTKMEVQEDKSEQNHRPTSQQQQKTNRYALRDQFLFSFKIILKFHSHTINLNDAYNRWLYTIQMSTIEMDRTTLDRAKRKTRNKKKEKWRWHTQTFDKLKLKCFRALCKLYEFHFYKWNHMNFWGGQKGWRLAGWAGRWRSKCWHCNENKYISRVFWECKFIHFARFIFHIKTTTGKKQQQQQQQQPQLQWNQFAGLNVECFIEWRIN